MEELASVIIYLLITLLVVLRLKKKAGGWAELFGGKTPSKRDWTGSDENGYSSGSQTYKETGVVVRRESGAADRSRESGAADRSRGSGAMPHRHRKVGMYDTYNKKSFLNDSGTMPHKHEKGHYTSMADTSKLPPGYILLNGEPVRVADLEGK